MILTIYYQYNSSIIKYNTMGSCLSLFNEDFVPLVIYIKANQNYHDISLNDIKHNAAKFVPIVYMHKEEILMPSSIEHIIANSILHDGNNLIQNISLDSLVDNSSLIIIPYHNIQGGQNKYYLNDTLNKKIINQSMVKNMSNKRYILINGKVIIRL